MFSRQRGEISTGGHLQAGGYSGRRSDDYNNAPRTCTPTYTNLPNEDSQSMSQSHCLSVGFLNVCGLKRRLEYPEFNELILKYDIICFAETKLDNTDVISCDGYTFFNKPRRERYIRKSGGLGFLVRNEICKHVSFVDAESEYVAWLKIRKSFQHQNDDLVIGSVYIPPQQSQFFSTDEFECFEREITSVCSSNDSDVVTCSITCI